MKSRKSKCKKASKQLLEDSCSYFTMTDKTSHRISLLELERVWNQSLNANRSPLIVMGIRRNDNEVFMITGELTIEKQRRSK